MDLLIAALWDRVVLGGLFVEDDTELPELTGVMPETPDTAEKTAVEAAEQTTEEIPANPDPSQESSSLYKVYGITLGSVAVVVVFASLILNHRRKEN